MRKPRSNAPRSRLSIVCYLGLGLLLLIVPMNYWLTGGWGRSSKRPDTLVVYNFDDSDPEHLANFNYFLRHAIRGNDGARYFLIFEHKVTIDVLELPPLPSNVEVVRAVGPCNEMGLVGWLFKRYPILTDHDYFVFLDSSVRGPFLPAYVQGVVWHRMLTRKLGGDVKLVAPTVSCAPFKYHENDGGYIIHPYVSAYVVATDRSGLKLLNATNPPVFHCYHAPLDIQRYGVISLTEAVLRKNLTFDTLMLKYQGVDWRDATKWSCNDRIDAHLPHHYDGMHLDPLEVMFVRIHHADVVTEAPNVVQAVKYDEWASTDKAPGSDAVSANEWRRRAPRLLPAFKARGQACFNAKHYIASSPHEFKGFNGDMAWNHFLQHGFREGRPFEFTC